MFNTISVNIDKTDAVLGARRIAAMMRWVFGSGYVAIVLLKVITLFLSMFNVKTLDLNQLVTVSKHD